MIKANELRIGNLVNGFGGVQKADTPYIGISVFYSPIPITPEWLVKLGFEKHEAGFSIDAFCVGNHGHFEIAIQMGEGLYYMSLHYYNHDIAYLPLPIEYVPQLQNTIFVITSIELTYTP